MSTTPKRLAVLASAAVAVAGMTVLAPPAQANPGGTGLVISEVYGGGGSSSASARIEPRWRHTSRKNSYPDHRVSATAMASSPWAR